MWENFYNTMTLFFILFFTGEDIMVRSVLLLLRIDIPFYQRTSVSLLAAYVTPE